MVIESLCSMGLISIWTSHAAGAQYVLCPELHHRPTLITYGRALTTCLAGDVVWRIGAFQRITDFIISAVPFDEFYPAVQLWSAGVRPNSSFGLRGICANVLFSADVDASSLLGWFPRIEYRVDELVDPPDVAVWKVSGDVASEHPWLFPVHGLLGALGLSVMMYGDDAVYALK